MKRKLLSVVAAAATALTFGLPAKPASAQDFWIGQIVLGGWTFCPRTTLSASGQLLSISQNSALFSLYGTSFGGDGRTTFGIPDLRGRYATSVGTGPGLSPIRIGQIGGRETETLNILNLPSHTHTIVNTATSNVAASAGPPATGASGKGFAGSAAIYSGVGAPSQGMQAGVVTTSVNSTVGQTGGNQAFSIKDPFLGLQYCVVQFGIFPSRS